MLLGLLALGVGIEVTQEVRGWRTGDLADWVGVQLWRSLQTLEEEGRVDAQIFREIESSLPIELGLDEWKTIIRRFIREQLTSKGIIASFSVHLKAGNPHVHIMTTLRVMARQSIVERERGHS